MTMNAASSPLSRQGYQRALVTGTSSGLGFALMRALVEEGLAVRGVGRRAPSDPPPGYTHLTADLLVEADIARVLKEIAANPPDIWINNAGFGLLGAAWTPDEADVDRQIDLLFRVPVRLSRFFAKICSQRPEQSAYLVQVSSLAAELPIPGMPYYNAAKAALSSFGESLLLDGELPFRTIDFRPGDFQTAFMDADRAQNIEADPDAWQRLLARHRKAKDPREAADCLIRAMRNGRSGTVRSGSFFQSRIAPLGPRLLPQRWLRACIRRHYSGK